MKNAKIKLQSMGFTFAHVQVLSIAVVILGVLLFTHSGISLHALISKAADDKPATLTYEEAKSQVLAENNAASSNDDKYLNDLDNQFALLDRGQIDGKVLGDMIGIGDVPDADAMSIPEVQQYIWVIPASADDAQARANYLGQVKQIETKYDTFSLLALMNSSDPDVIKGSVDQWKKVLNDISYVPVPSSLVAYHKAKLTYYAVIMNVAEIYGGQKDESQLQYYTKAMLSYGQKVGSIESSLGINSD